MSTITTNARVARLRQEAEAKVEAAATLFAALSARQAATATEIGWTVAATAWHLSFGARLTNAQIKELKQGKVRHVPCWLVDFINRATIPWHRRTPLALSVTHLRAAIAESAVLLADWTDDDLATPITPPANTATTYEELLRRSLIAHYDDHLGQIRRAVKP
jgi:hypothetical protein